MKIMLSKRILDITTQIDILLHIEQGPGGQGIDLFICIVCRKTQLLVYEHLKHLTW